MRHLEELEGIPKPSSRSLQLTKKTRRTPYKVKVIASVKQTRNTSSLRDQV
jgi:hypothetical protein